METQDLFINLNEPMPDLPPPVETNSKPQGSPKKKVYFISLFFFSFLLIIFILPKRKKTKRKKIILREVRKREGEVKKILKMKMKNLKRKEEEKKVPQIPTIQGK